jgi:cytochrome c6
MFVYMEALMKKFIIAFSVIVAFISFASAQDAGAGKEIFTAKCAICHGADGRGKTPMGTKFNIKNLAAPEVQKQSDAELTAIVIKGKAKMPAFEGKLTSEQVAQVLGYIRQIGKQK